jgi:hypothetical protein
MYRIALQLLDAPLLEAEEHVDESSPEQLFKVGGNISSKLRSDLSLNRVQQIKFPSITADAGHGTPP